MNLNQTNLKLLFPYLKFSVMLYLFAEVCLNYKVHLLGREDTQIVFQEPYSEWFARAGDKN
ncbi:MAG: hypothetical protein COA79_22135 [Planctomycetota bacterium]|nr:MAG: hypothetical protein COA79_22135 [Planctomycetota bacterium]